MLEKIKRSLDRYDLNNPILSLRAANIKFIRSIIDSKQDEGKKELNHSINSFNIYIETIIEANFLPRLSPIINITNEGIKKHYITHIVLYFLNKKGISLFTGEGFVYSKDNILKILGMNDKMGFTYDLYSMYLYEIGFDENIFNQDFLLKKKDLVDEFIDDLYIGEVQGGNDKFNIKDIVNDNINIISKNDEKEFLLLEQTSDLLGLIDTGFKGDFSISGNIFYAEHDGDNPLIFGETLPTYIIPIIHKVFGDNKSIKITKDNYLEYKQKFKDARVEYLEELGIKDHSDKKEIREVINKKIDKIARVNTLRIRDPEKEGYKDKKVKQFTRKISLLAKLIEKNEQKKEK